MNLFFFKKKKGLQGVAPETAQQMIFVIRNVTRNRAAIEVKNMKKTKIKKEKKENIKKGNRNPEPWTLKVALRPSGVLLVLVLVKATHRRRKLHAFRNFSGFFCACEDVCWKHDKSLRNRRNCHQRSPWSERRDLGAVSSVRSFRKVVGRGDGMLLFFVRNIQDKLADRKSEDSALHLMAKIIPVGAAI